MAEFDVVAARLCGEGEGGVEEREGAVDEAEGAERVGCCEGGGGEGGEGEAQAGGGGEVEERWEGLLEVQWEDGLGDSQQENGVGGSIPRDVAVNAP